MLVFTAMIYMLVLLSCVLHAVIYSYDLNAGIAQLCSDCFAQLWSMCWYCMAVIFMLVLQNFNASTCVEDSLQPSE